MSIKLFFLPYKKGSRSCNVLAAEVGAKRIRLAGSKFRAAYDRLVINWGNSRMKDITNPLWLNEPEAVEAATNKLTAFKRMRSCGVPIPEITNNPAIAAEWATYGDTVIGRATLTGSGGAGIHIFTTGDEIMNGAYCPLYTKYFKAKAEYRVHVFGGKVIDVQEKRKRADAGDVDYRVRNHAGGFVFCREDVQLPEVCADAAVRAVAALGLDFGAVDMRYNEHYGTACVLEVNTAPGLEGSTLDSYVAAISAYVAELNPENAV